MPMEHGPEGSTGTLPADVNHFEFVRKLSFFPDRARAVARRDLPAAISTIYLDINTDICNHACTFCDGFYRQLRAATLPWVRLSRLVDEMEEVGVLAVVIAGDRGEPLLHPSFGTLLEKLVKTDIKVGIYTNGTILKDDWLPLMTKVGFLRISADAASSPTHRRMHVYPDTRADFVTVQQNVQRLAETVDSVGVSFIVHPYNAGEIELAAELFLGLGASFIEYKPHYLPQYGVDSAWWRSAGPHVAASLARVRARWGGRAIVNNQIDHLIASSAGATLTVPPRMCRTSLLRLVISTHGCYTCTPWRGEAERRVGDILGQSLLDVVQSAARQALVERPCDRLCAYHAQNELLLELESTGQALSPACGVPAPQDCFI